MFYRRQEDQQDTKLDHEFSLRDFEIRELADDIVLATFKTEKIFSDKSRMVSLRASIWRKANENWQMIFHQGTPIKKD